MDDDAREKVSQGAELLDRKKPGWQAEIDEYRLEMSDGFSCILGQLFAGIHSGFYHGKMELFPNRDLRVQDTQLVVHGFDIDWRGESPSHKELGEAWIEAIHKRRERE